MKAANRTSWEIISMPESRVEIRVQKRYTAKQFSQMRLGLIPQQMEDKWFIFFENNFIYFHRSWTGIEIYRVELIEEPQCSVTISHCWVNNDKDQYNLGSEEYEAQMVCFLIDRLLLSKKVAFPTPKDVKSEDVLIYQHGVIGYGRSNKE